MSTIIYRVLVSKLVRGATPRKSKVKIRTLYEPNAKGEVGGKSPPGPVGKSSGPSHGSLWVNEWHFAEITLGKRVAGGEPDEIPKKLRATQGKRELGKFLLFGVDLRHG
jgi:hypothetical protein